MMLSRRLENCGVAGARRIRADARAEYSVATTKVGCRVSGLYGKRFTGKVKKDPAAIKAYFRRTVSCSASGKA